MAYIKTSKGDMEYQYHIPKFYGRVLDKKKNLENLRIISVYLDKIGINWGPAFGTLIGIVRNNDFLPWAEHIDLYILKEDEERFKDVLWLMSESGFKLTRYERRGFYVIERDNESTCIYVLRKISYDIRHTGGRDFIHERYLQNMTKWDFNGIMLNVPVALDEYLTFQYNDWIEPKQTINNKYSPLRKICEKCKYLIKDHLPDWLYYPLILNYHKADFNRFKTQCERNGVLIPSNVELSYQKPRKGKRVLTVGVYDLIHKGHVELYRRAKGLGDYLIVAAQDSDYVIKYKPTAKILNSTEDRMYMIKSIRYVDEVIVYKDVDDIVKKVKFDVFVTGPDQIHDGFQRAIKWCEENGKEHVVLGRTDGISSSELKAKIAEKKQNSQKNKHIL